MSNTNSIIVCFIRANYTTSFCVFRNMFVSCMAFSTGCQSRS